MENISIISRAKALNLPFGEYCVFGSGVQEIHGLKKAKDVDILVTGKLYIQLKKAGWKRKWFFWRGLWCKCVTNGTNEAFTNIHWTWKYRPDTQEIINRAEVHNGIPFLRIEDLLEFSRYLPREKDKQTVKRIEAYLAAQTR